MRQIVQVVYGQIPVLSGEEVKLFPGDFCVLEKGAAGHLVAEGKEGDVELGSLPRMNQWLVHIQVRKGHRFQDYRNVDRQKRGRIMKAPTLPPSQGCTQESVRNRKGKLFVNCGQMQHSSDCSGDRSGLLQHLTQNRRQVACH